MIPDMMLHVSWQGAMIHMTVNHYYDSRHDVTRELAIGYDSYDCESLL